MVVSIDYYNRFIFDFGVNNVAIETHNSESEQCLQSQSPIISCSVSVSFFFYGETVGWVYCVLVLISQKKHSRNICEKNLPVCVNYMLIMKFESHALYRY